MSRAVAGRGTSRGQSMLAALALLVLAGCGDATTPSNIATNPGVQMLPNSASASAAAGSGMRTVLSPLGLNIHAQPQLSAAVLGTAAQGVSLAVVDKNDQNGGWFKVQGQTLTGWIVADPTLTAAGLFVSYQSSQRLFNVLYPQDWTFAEEPTDALFHPIAGPLTIVARNAARVADFGPSGGSGYVSTSQETVVVCGVTGSLNQYSHARPAVSTPPPGTAGPLELLAQIRLTLDGSHALSLDYNYRVKDDLRHFSDFYNSMTFPFPQCQATPPATPSPS